MEDAPDRPPTDKELVSAWLRDLLEEERIRDEGRDMRERLNAAKERRELAEAQVKKEVVVTNGAKTFVIEADGRSEVVRLTRKGLTRVPPGAVE